MTVAGGNTAQDILDRRFAAGMSAYDASNVVQYARGGNLPSLREDLNLITGRADTWFARWKWEVGL